MEERRNGRRGAYSKALRILAVCLSVLLGMLFVLEYCPIPVHAQSADIAAFPQSYQSALSTLKEKHPSWTFVPVVTGIDWNTAVSKELQDGRSLVYKSFANCTKEGAYDQGNWFYASKEILAYYMDPRNNLTEERIFQFEQLSFNEEYHTQAGLEVFLNNTFMGNGAKVPNTAMTYPFLIYACGKHADVRTSPFHLAARIYQEQGKGTSPLISGTVEGYEGYYNYFNFGASGNTNAEVIKNGLEYAKKNWGKEMLDDAGNVVDAEQGAYNAIFGGSKLLAKNYIKKGQDTLYLQKFDLVSSTPFTHQYMQNISAPTTEAKTIKNLYTSASSLECPFVFHIPVYQNMPAQACPMPTSSTNIVLFIPTDMTLTKVMVDGVEYEGTNYYDYASRKRRLVVTLPDGNRRNAAIEIKDANGQVINGYYWKLTYQGTYYEAVAGSKPVLTNDIYLELPDNISASEAWLDGIPYAVTMESGRARVTAPDQNAGTAVIYSYDADGSPKDMHVWTLVYGADGYEAKLQPELQGLLNVFGFSVRTQGEIGLRFITGISEQTRESLLADGIDGYRLKEYGTITMPNAARETLPMIKGGQYTVSGISYGTLANGTKLDAVYDTRDGKILFSNVLTQLTPYYYRTAFAFRGYVVLEKESREIVLYGPVLVRNLYSVAKEMLSSNDAQEEQKVLLRELMDEADGL